MGYQVIAILNEEKTELFPFVYLENRELAGQMEARSETQ